MKKYENTPLAERERDAINTAVALLKKDHPVKKAILYGSKTRGDDDEHSDIDLLIITSRPLHWKEEKAIVESLFDIGMEHDVIFTPLFVSDEEWEGGIFTTFPIYKEIMDDGALVA
jgi:predicted nucleotidyltransferase